MFVARVEIATAIIAKLTIILLSNFPASCTGSQIVFPYTIAVAEVTDTPIKANKVIEGGRPIACPAICAFCDFAYRVKSGMLSESVAQNPTIPVNAGKKKFQNAEPLVNFDG